MLSVYGPTQRTQQIEKKIKGYVSRFEGARIVYPLNPVHTLKDTTTIKYSAFMSYNAEFKEKMKKYGEYKDVEFQVGFKKATQKLMYIKSFDQIIRDMIAADFATIKNVMWLNGIYCDLCLAPDHTRSTCDNCSFCSSSAHHLKDCALARSFNEKLELKYEEVVTCDLLHYKDGYRDGHPRKLVKNIAHPNARTRSRAKNNLKNEELLYVLRGGGNVKSEYLNIIGEGFVTRNK